MKYERAGIENLTELNRFVAHNSRTERRDVLIPADPRTIDNYFLAFDDDLVGFSRVWIDSYPKMLVSGDLSGDIRPDNMLKRGEVTSVFVISSYRRRGIGSELVQMAVEYLQTEGCEMIIAVGVDHGRELFGSLPGWRYKQDKFVFEG
ncbi:GNAT family N-acetyltransferase [Candidatus Woesearchaeota archaeon]|nr:GNAT family N-acetyltransferase [Candidatus Woesearchaeota archaeon]